MRFIYGFIVGVLLVIGGAYIHDNLEPGSANPLVNWSNVSNLERATYDYTKAQFERLINWATSSSR
jgi:hypothetical protein